ncbi:hypothetical protein SELMODRAFT_413101 [Selaginella moellendorffii]|uniref:CG-1 domain-containing protein n=1 Tax=Selaginella moellendorffii TaxID=88036 RepID=D8RNC3_SELML|nr:calmodulin-binding transcription activator 3 [Selaginella moellendorffii]EFJ26472.1 hypothetical protein SELMODRAFT_413101 [Selaginella moellendorffii]|eukprot:XP_002972386.1 calmodulin-binding transcription activator 3 [Selaginella moellendorffii]
MYDNRRLRFFPSQPEIDIYQIIREAQNRWLRPLEVIEILRNYQKFRLNPVPPNKPPSGSLFLFDRKTLRFFRKDGHNWRKKKDGKTVREAHERLKAGSVDVLHCYYAHGEDNPNFQRRSYWMLEGAYEHIVLVHYREVTEGSRSSVYRSMQEAKENASHSRATGQSLPASNSAISDVEVTGPYKSPEAPVTPIESEGTDSGEEGHVNENNVVEQSSLLQQVAQSSPVAPPSTSVPVAAVPAAAKNLEGVDYDDLLRNPDAYLGQKSIDAQTWSTLLDNFGGTNTTEKMESTSQSHFLSPGFSNHVYNSITPTNHPFPPVLSTPDSQHMEVDLRQAQYSAQDVSKKPQTAIPNDASEYYKVALPDVLVEDEGKTSLKKLDSFGRWMSREIGEDSQSSLLSGSTDHAYWTLDDHNTFDEISNFTQQIQDVGLGPSVSQDQQFSIVDFSPDWAFSSEETKVIVAGNFLKRGASPVWHCMFGEVEVPAETIHEGVLRCKAPIHSPGRVPLYITLGDRVACSEIREFEYRTATMKPVAGNPEQLQVEDEVLEQRFARLISLNTDEATKSEEQSDKVQLSKILELTSGLWEDPEPSESEVGSSTRDTVLQTLLKQQLQRWLLVKVCDRDKGAAVLDAQGQSALHLAAALGYDWAVNPILAAGVGVNFRDVHGWTGLHWAASRGREKVVSTLLAAGASPGLVTDPTPQNSSGRTPADLAASSGHKGMAGLLAEMSLTTHLTSLTLKERNTDEIDSLSAVLAEEKAVEDFSDNQAANGGTDRSLLQGSLRAVRNAARAAALIHASFRQESFRRRQEKIGEEIDNEYGMSMNELKVLASRNGGANRKEHSAATKIQQKYRGWKGRRDFLLLRQRVVRIQAHVRGHQVRRKFRKILWTVGILDKAILRWRRKRGGLRRASAQTQNTDDDDVLKAGRKQKEAQFQKAVTRVQSMVRSHEAQEQYQRIQEAYLQAVAGDSQARNENERDETMLG